MRGVSLALEIDSASSFGHYVGAAGLLSARPTKSQIVVGMSVRLICVYFPTLLSALSPLNLYSIPRLSAVS
jgi:hypothetical protein